MFENHSKMRKRATIPEPRLPHGDGREHSNLAQQQQKQQQQQQRPGNAPSTSSRCLRIYRCSVIAWGVASLLCHCCLYFGFQGDRLTAMFPTVSRSLSTMPMSPLSSPLSSQSKKEMETELSPPHVSTTAIMQQVKTITAANAPNTDNDHDHSQPIQQQQQQQQRHDYRQETNSTCALNFFGLPRSFDTLVLPSIIENVLKPNAQYHCDVYFHYYDMPFEKRGRFSLGGKIDTSAVFRLKDEVQKAYREDVQATNSPPQDEKTAATKATTVFSWLSSMFSPPAAPSYSYPDVHFLSDTKETFQKARAEQLDTYLNTKDKDGKYVYFPYKAPSWSHPNTLVNVIMQWHSIERVWELMETSGKQHDKAYSRVAMLRNDVVYTTAIDIYDDGDATSATGDVNVLTIPAFAPFPVNDRMIYGPHDGVKTWATRRFASVADYARNPPRKQKGWILHAERYLANAIFPQILKQNFDIDQDESVCFLRARADGSVLLNDCDERYEELTDEQVGERQRKVERVTGADCSSRDVEEEDGVYFARCKKRKQKTLIRKSNP